MNDQSFSPIDSPSLARFFAQNPDIHVATFPFHKEEAVAQLNWEGIDQQEAIPELRAYQRLLQIYPDPQVAKLLLQTDVTDAPPPALLKSAAADSARSERFDSAHKITSLSREHFLAKVGPQLGESGPQKAGEIYDNAAHIRNQTMHVWANLVQLQAPHYQALSVNATSPDILDHYTSLPSYDELFGSLNYCECQDCQSIFGPAAYFVDLMRVIEQYVTKPNAKEIDKGMSLLERRADLAKIELTCENTNKTMPYLTIVNERLEEAVQEAWGGQDKLYPSLAKASYPSALPFHLPLAKIRIYLQRLSVQLEAVYRTLPSQPTDVAAHTLGLSPEEWQLIATSESDVQKLQTYFGVSDLAQLTDASVFCKKTGLKVTDLRQLLEQDLSADEQKAGIANNFFINRDLAAPVALVLAEDSSQLQNLVPKALDRIHRFLRLTRKLGWSYAELDWVLHVLNPDTVALDEAALIGIAAIEKLRRDTGLSVLAACALLYDLKTYGDALFDQVYNGSGMSVYHPKDAGSENYRWNQLYKQDAAVWKIGATDEANRKQAGRIAGGLGLQQDDLSALAEALFGASAEVSLTVANLSKLYQHVKLAALLKLPVAQYIKFRQLTGTSFAERQSAAQISDLLGQASQLRRMNLQVYELDYVMNAVTSPFVQVAYQDKDVDPWLKNLPALTASTAEDADQQKKEQEEKIRQQIASFLSARTEQIDHLLHLAGRQEVADLFLSEKSKKEAVQLLQLLSRWLLLTRKLRLTNDELDNLGDAKAAYGIADVSALTLKNILDLGRWKELRASFADTTGNLFAFMSAASDEQRASALADLTGRPLGQISRLLGLFAAAGNRVDQLAATSRAIGLLGATGADPEFLLHLQSVCTKGVDEAWDDYEKTADDLLALVRARLAVANWDECFAQIDGEIQEQKRTVLIATALVELPKTPERAWITNSRRLYEYLLIDVEMGGTTRISYIKEALNAAQLYLSRCRELLEPGIVHWNIPDPWWEWLLNYRTWEANRKIFLYPENYLDPAYRKSKTSLFEELENTLKQGEVNAQTVEQAFTKYLDRFAELAKLKYVDAYYGHIVGADKTESNQLFLVARTETQPYKYYYLIRNQDTTWSEWQEMDVTISAETVTLVHAFNRLFVFWVEQKKFDKNNGNESAKKATKAAIKYSFYNFSGKWVQPQTLADDIIINVEGSAYQKKYESLLPGSLFAPNQIAWQKVYPLTIQKDQFWVPGAGTNSFEKVILLYGPMLDLEASPALNKVDAPDRSDETTQQFESELYQTLRYFSQAKSLSYDGLLPLQKPIVINDDLQVGFLANPNEFLLFAKDSDQSTPQVRTEIDRSAGRLNLIQTNQLVYDNDLAEQITVPSPVLRPVRLTANSFVSSEVGIESAGSTAIFNQLVAEGYVTKDGSIDLSIPFDDVASSLEQILDGQPGKEDKLSACIKVVGRAVGTPWLSTAMRNKDYGLFPVKNHPSAFVFRGDKEFILLLDGEQQTSAINRSLLNNDTLFTPDSFVSAAVGIEKTGAQAIYQALITSGFLDARGRLDEQTELEDLTEFLQTQLAIEDQMYAVRNILMHRPVFSKDDFIAAAPIDIQQSGSELIFQQLIAAGYLDKTGRLDADTDFYELEESVADIFQGQLNPDKKTRYVVDTLYQRSFPTTVGYLNTDPAIGGIYRFRFEAIRLTTAAVHRLSSRLFTGGVDALLSLSSQQIPLEQELPFERFQFSESWVAAPEALDGAQVDFSGAYGPYYWELFFHAPLYIANLLKTNQQFQEAAKWYQFIFNPTVPVQPLQTDSFQSSTLGLRDSQRIYRVLVDQKIITADGQVSATYNRKTNLAKILPFLKDSQVTTVKNILCNHQLSSLVARFWQFQPFRNRTLEALREQLGNPNEIKAYNDDPFDPHAIARLRNGAYEKAVVMQYIDNLLQWGDSQFAQYTWESIIAATMHYVYAYNLLGERPQNLGKCPDAAPLTFAEIYSRYQENIPQFLIELEHDQDKTDSLFAFAPINALDTYFCVPENKQFSGYWDLVEDRLYKIRHGLNLQGIPQPLALFEPPLDPMQLVRAASAGQDVLSALTQSRAEIPFYRFSYLLERAKSMTSTLIQLGSTLLSTLEKKDAESLALLRSAQEKQLLNLTTMIKEKQIEELGEIIASLEQSKEGAKTRFDHYSRLFNENLNALEVTDLTLRSTAIYQQIAGVALKGLSIPGFLAPKIFGLANGNMQFGDAINAGAQVADGTAQILDHMAGLMSTGAQYMRRREEWALQRDVASYEIAQMDKQIAGSKIRQDMLRRELEIHQKGIEQAKDYEDYLKAKFTNEELYQWMVGRLSSVYFQTYRIALDMAISAQKSFQYELNRNDQFLQFDYWDSLHRGLTAGEGLQLSLAQMEKAYMEQNSRDYEIEKTISLLHLDPEAFLAFKDGSKGGKKGELTFTLSEKLFDFDFPGHYSRKIKSISVTIPAIVGPYQNVNATLTQNSYQIVRDAKPGAVQHLIDPNQPAPTDGSLIFGTSPYQRIALSRGMNDPGLFMLDWRDERYLPFEGTGAVSNWTLSLPPETNRIDFGSISDILLKIQYTAKDGGQDFANQVKSMLASQQPPYPYTPAKIIDLKQAFPGDWSRFWTSPPQAGVKSIRFALADAVILPNLKDVRFLSAAVFLQTPDGKLIADKDSSTHFLQLQIGDEAAKPIPIANNYGSVDLSDVPLSASSAQLQFHLAELPDGLVTTDAASGEREVDRNSLLGIVVIFTYQSNVFATK